MKAEKCNQNCKHNMIVFEKETRKKEKEKEIKSENLFFLHQIKNLACTKKSVTNKNERRPLGI